MKRAVLTLLICLLAAGCRTNPVTGRREVALFSTQQELALGAEYHPSLVLMHDGEYQDEALKGYLGSIVGRIHAVSHRREMPVQFTVLNTSVVNGFATPGYVYATRGFLAQLQNEAQFAAVMAHEMAHVAAGHTAQEMTHQVFTSIGLGLAGAALGDSAGSQRALAVGRAGVALLGLSYSREQERQADRVGTYYMALAGWDPRQAISMQKLMTSLDKREETVVDRYLSTHPPASERIGELESYIRHERLLEKGLMQRDGLFADRWQKQVAALSAVNRAYEPYDKGAEHLGKKEYEQALQEAERAIALRSDQAPFHRLRGDALLGLERLDAAETAYREALRLYPGYALPNIGLGRLALARKDYVRAEAEFAMASRAFPASLAARYGLGLARYDLGRYRDAIAPLEAVTGALPEDPIVHYMLALCYDNAGRAADAYRAYGYALSAGLAGAERQRAEERVRVLGGSLSRSSR